MLGKALYQWIHIHEHSGCVFKCAIFTHNKITIMMPVWTGEAWQENFVDVQM